MSTLDRTLPVEKNNWHVIALGTILTVGSLLAAGWLLVGVNDIPGGLSTLLLTVAGALLIAIGNAEASRPNA